MKRLLVLFLAVLMIMSLTACKEEEKVIPDTTGGHFVEIFIDSKDKELQDIANDILGDEMFAGKSCTTTEVGEGQLQGFGNVEISGFDSAVMFSTNMSTTPFIGYVFELSSDTDKDAFMQTLKDNADLNWNGIEKADEVIVESEGDKVVVIITPDKIEEVETVDESGNPVENEIPVEGQEFVDEFAE
ncbi:MAG: hypothetical protein IKB73_06205 [Ruminococcus sp.]|nr:hypothetical protein [Ruminococcus sp.]